MKNKRCELAYLGLQYVPGTGRSRAGQLDALVDYVLDSWNVRQAALCETYAILLSENERSKRELWSAHHDVLLVELLAGGRQ